MAFELPKLGYAYDALEPNIDARTMEIHHSKHHNGYTNNLNNAIAGTDLEGKTIEDILTNLDMNNGAVRNNGGGFYNHSLFWEVMNPEEKGYLSGELKDAIVEAYGSVDAFKEAFAKALGTGMRFPVNFKSIEVIHDSLGKPKIKTIPKLTSLVKSHNIKHCHLSISDEKNIAVAFVILEQ